MLSKGKLAALLIKVAVPLAKNVAALLATMKSVSAIEGAIQRRMYERGVVRGGKILTLVISNEDIDDIIRILQLLENSNENLLKDLVKQ